MKRFFNAVLGIFLCAFFLVTPVFAQIASDEPGDVLMDEVVLVADVSIYGAEVTKQEGNVFTISFDLVNREGAQPDVRFAVQLLKSGEDDIVVDQFTVPEKISLLPNTREKKEIVYTAPEHLKGTYELVVVSENGSGVMLSFGFPGEVTLSGDGEYLEVLAPTCFVQVEGEEGQPKYELLQGVDIADTETLNLTCTIENHSEKDLTLTPAFETFYRTPLGDKVESTAQAQEPFNIKALEKKTVTIQLPKALIPQSYDVKVLFKNDANLFSSFVNIHYVLQGQSATLQNLLLDKTFYNEGETAQVTVIWSASADGFVGSRSGEESTVEGMATTLTVVDENGVSCGTSTHVTLNPENIKEVIPFKIENMCVSPKVTTTLSDNTGKVLAASTFDFISPESEIPQDLSEESSPSSLFSYVVGGGILLLVLISYLVFLLKKKKDVTESVIPPVALFVAFFVGAAIVMGTPFESQAKTISVGGDKDKVEFSYDVEDDNFDEGDNVDAYAKAKDFKCSNRSGKDWQKVKIGVDSDGGSWHTLKNEGSSYEKGLDDVDAGSHEAHFDFTVYACKTGGTKKSEPCKSPKWYDKDDELDFNVRRDGGWSSWGACTPSTCGTTGTQYRTCTNPPPKSGGDNCSGPSSQPCTNPACPPPPPVACVYGAFGDWSACSATCGTGTQIRTKVTIGPFNGGAACPLPVPTETQNCNTFACTASINANPTTIVRHSNATLSWVSPNTTSCTASGDWSGVKIPISSESTGNLNFLKTYDFTLVCSGGGINPSAPATAHVVVRPPQCDDGLDNDGDGIDRIDMADPGCHNVNDDNEGDEEKCQNRKDDDHDGYCDGFASTCVDGSTPGDPGCFEDDDPTNAYLITDDNEDNCGNGICEDAYRETFGTCPADCEFSWKLD